MTIYEDYLPQIPKAFAGDSELSIWAAGVVARMAFFYNDSSIRYSLAHPNFQLALDGTTDDTAAFQAAIDWVEDQGGGRLEIPPNKTILISSTLVFPRSPLVDLVGWGQFSRIEHTGTGPAIQLSDTQVNVVSFFEFSNFRIDCTGGGSGIALSNSRAETVLSGTVSASENNANPKYVTGVDTSFLTDLDDVRDAVEIDGVEYEIRTNGVRTNELLELADNFVGTVNDVGISRVRYGNGTRWGTVHRVWIQGPSEGAEPDTYGILLERGNNITFRNLVIREFDIGFKVDSSVSGRSAGCWMDTVIVSASTSYGFYFYDARSFALKRCRSEGDPAIAWYLELCDTHLFDACSAEDDHATAGWYLKNCDRLQGNISIGTNFGGGYGIQLVNSDLCTFWGGHAAYQSNRTTLLSRGSMDTQIASAAFTLWLAGISYSKGAVAAGTAIGAQTVPANKWACYRLSIDSSLTITVTPAADNTTGYDEEADAIAAQPALPANSQSMGRVTVRAQAGNPWIAGTDALAGGVSGNPAQTTNYSTTDLLVPAVHIDSASQSNSFERFAVENYTTAGVYNASTTTTGKWLDWDNTRAAIVAENIPTLEHQKTVTAGTTSLSIYDAGTILIDNSGGAVTLALPNAVATNLGLRFCFFVLGNSANTVTIQRAGSDVIDGFGTTTTSNTFTMASGECAVLEATEVGHWKYLVDTGVSSTLSGGTTGDILYYNGSAWVKLGIGAANRVLDSSGSAPRWTDVPTLAGLLITGTAVLENGAESGETIDLSGVDPASPPLLVAVGAAKVANLDVDLLDGQSGAYYLAAANHTGFATIATSGSASDLSAGTIPDARFPATLPAASGVNLTALNATQLTSGTVPDARLSSSVVLTSGSQTIAGVKTFTSAPIVTRTNATDLAWRGNTSGGVGVEIQAGGAYTIGNPGSARDCRMQRSGTKTIQFDDNAGGDVTVEIIGALTLTSFATATTVGAAGGASALPATPTGYLTVSINGANQKIPYYAT